MFQSLCPLKNTFRKYNIFTFRMVHNALLFSCFVVIEIVINNTFPK